MKQGEKNKKILFLGQLPEGHSPSQRFRIEAYKELMREVGIMYYFEPFISEKYYPYLYQQGHLLRKIFGVLGGFARRLKGLFRYRNVDYVFVQREATPIGPPFFEWFYSKVLGKKLIYDFDDAIWLPNVTAANRLAQHLKCYWKVGAICKWAYKVSVGNHFLGNYAKQFTSNVVYNPTCVDTEHRFNVVAKQDASQVTIGWTGSHSTLPFLELSLPALQKLEEEYDFRLLVICNRKPEFKLHSLEFLPWNAMTEIEDLSKINIGIMPLKEDVWSEGKCGFKLIQYMALGIPALASPVGVNKDIISNGVNGYLCKTDEDWVNCLAALLRDREKRLSMGRAGMKKIESEYSISANAANFLSLFDKGYSI